MASRITIERDTQKISKIFKALNTAVSAVILKHAMATQSEAYAVMAYLVNKKLIPAQKMVNPIIAKSIHDHYATSALIASNAMKRSGLEVFGGLDSADRLAIETLVNQTVSDYNEIFKGVTNSASNILTTARQKRVNLTIQYSSEGKALAGIKEDVKKEIQKELFSIRDKSGRKWKMDVYAEMLTRTRLREVTNSGMSDRLLREGYDLVQVSDHHSNHYECAQYERKILSLTGRTVGYPTVEEATLNGLFHPNCKHRLLPYHEQFATPDNTVV